MLKNAFLTFCLLVTTGTVSFAQNYYDQYTVPALKPVYHKPKYVKEFPRPSARHAVTDGQTSMSSRLRFEHFKNSAKQHDSNAITLRTTLGYQTKKYKGFKAAIEAENIVNLGPDTYFDGQNGEVLRPMIPDPEATEINQAYIHFQAKKGLEAQAGRFELTLGNERFISNNPWRQNHQSFDGALVKSDALIKDMEIVYGYLRNVNTHEGDDGEDGNLRGDIHLLNIARDYTNGKATSYLYMMDFKRKPKWSSQTIGTNFTGQIKAHNVWDIGYELEFARQSDYGKNPNSYDLHYYKIEPYASFKGLTFRGGYEVLEGNGTASFQTPLADTHKFNGFTDRFTETPVNGLTDLYLETDMTFKSGHPSFGDLYTKTAYHSFSAENGDMDYGSEWSFQFTQKVFDDYDIGFLYADFNGKDQKPNVQKAAFMVQTKF